jgi:hypothetical protein
MHYYQLVYQVDVPKFYSFFQISKTKNPLTAFFGGAFICGGNGGT